MLLFPTAQFKVLCASCADIADLGFSDMSISPSPLENQACTECQDDRQLIVEASPSHHVTALLRGAAAHFA